MQWTTWVPGNRNLGLPKGAAAMAVSAGVTGLLATGTSSVILQQQVRFISLHTVEKLSPTVIEIQQCQETRDEGDHSSTSARFSIQCHRPGRLLVRTGMPHYLAVFIIFPPESNRRAQLHATDFQLQLPTDFHSSPLFSGLKGHYPAKMPS